MIRRPPRSTRPDALFPYTTLFRSLQRLLDLVALRRLRNIAHRPGLNEAQDLVAILDGGHDHHGNLRPAFTPGTQAFETLPAGPQTFQQDEVAARVAGGYLQCLAAVSGLPKLNVPFHRYTPVLGSALGETLIGGVEVLH